MDDDDRDELATLDEAWGEADEPQADASAGRDLGPYPYSTVHACPPGDEALTPCCGRSPFELLADRMTLHDELVTCRG